jgi:predicted transposase/invertase (TIGR01784 family)
LYSQQLLEGEDYKRLRPAYLISFVNARVIAESTAFHTRFVLRDAAHDLTFTDDFALHMIELTKFLAVVGEAPDSLNNWCNFLMNANQVDTETVKSPAIRKAMVTLREISDNEREREVYESRRKRQLDDMSLAAQYARQDAEFAQAQAELARVRDELRNQRLAEIERYRAVADQLQLLADPIEDPEAKADLLRQRSEQLAQVETLLNVLRGAP